MTYKIIKLAFWLEIPLYTLGISETVKFTEWYCLSYPRKQGSLDTILKNGIVSYTLHFCKQTLNLYRSSVLSHIH